VALKADARVPFIWELDVQGVDYGFLRGSTELEPHRSEAYAFSYIEPSSFDFFMGEPEPILQIDLAQMRDAEEIATRYSVQRRVVRAGSLDGLCAFFRAAFDDEVGLSTAPDRPGTHWGTRLFRAPHVAYTAGDTIAYELAMGSLRNANTWSARVVGG
jgi:type I protein arginine methyltransferase